ncbi:MAG: DUF2723 domain-containing protein [Melioribacteraceae bacterium]
MWVKFELIKKYYAEITGLIVFIIYLTTIAPAVIQIDSGELAAVQSTLGIAHPTGYPLFTLIGFLFLKIPLTLTKIFQANLLASIWCAVGIVFFVKSVNLILSNIKINFNSRLKEKEKKKSYNKNYGFEQENILVSTFSGLFLAFSKTYWFQSTSVEVYSLQIFLFNLIIYLSLKTFYENKNDLYEWTKVGAVLALGFSNHMTTLLVLPFIAILFFVKEKLILIATKKLIVTFLISTCIIVLFYLYLPLRASSNPELNWGNPINFENFWRHFTGKQYQVWLFSSFDSAEKQFNHYLQNLPDEFTYAYFIFVLAGIFYSLKVSKRFFYLLLVTFLFSVLYVINYDIVDIDSYFLLSFIMLSFFGAFGIKFIFEKLTEIYYSLSITLIVLIFVFASNFSQVNQSDVYTFEDYTKSILQSVEKNSLILTYQWDYFVSPSYYYQYVENFRKDVVVIDKELLRRSWYYNQLKRNYPDVTKNIQNDINNFLIAVKPFERSENYDSNILEKYYRKILTGLVSDTNRVVYIGLELFQNEMQRGELQLPEGYQIVPHLFMFKVVKGNEYVPAPVPDFKIRFPKNRNKYIDFIENVLGTMLTYRAMYEIQYGKIERAKMYVNKIKSDLKNFQIPKSVLQFLN